jgi:hypothetical protein
MSSVNEMESTRLKRERETGKQRGAGKYGELHGVGFIKLGNTV